MYKSRKKKTDEKLIKLFFSVMLLVVMVGSAFLLALKPVKAAIEADTDMFDFLPSTATFGGRIFCPDDDCDDPDHMGRLKIIEVVPDATASELYLNFGFDNDKFAFSDLLKINDLNAAKDAIQRFANAYRYNVWGDSNRYRIALRFNDKNEWYITNHWEFTAKINSFADLAKVEAAVYDTQTENIIGYIDDDDNPVFSSNIFAHAVFDGLDMDDKIDYQIIKASDLTVTDVRNCDFMYINGCGHFGGSNDGQNAVNVIYQIFKDNYSKMTNPSKDYSDIGYKCNIAQSTNTFQTNGVDLDKRVASEIIYQYTTQDLSILFDGAVRSGTNNVSKMYNIMFGCDRESLVKGFIDKRENDNKYSGELGYFDMNELELYKFGTPDTKLENSMTMFMYSGLPTDGYHFYNAGVIPKEFINKNLMYYNGDNVFGKSWFSASGSIAKPDEKTYVSSEKEMLAMYGDPENYTIDYVYFIKYLIGAFRDYQEIGHLDVLEIDPAGFGEYDNLNGAKKIARYFGTYFEGMNESNYTDYVNVRCIASKGFIGLTEDFVTEYDLIIVNDYNSCTYVSNKVTIESAIYADDKVYTSLGSLTQLENPFKKGNLSVANVNYSGNDLTEKALGKLKEFINIGKPVILCEKIYKGEYKDAENFSKLAYDNIKDDLYVNNLVKESSDNKKFEHLKYCDMQDIALDSSLETTWNGDIIEVKYTSNPIVTDKINISNFQVKGFIDTKVDGRYRIVVWFDKDGNGIYSADDFEIYFDDIVTTSTKEVNGKNVAGYFETPLGDNGIELPEDMRGYNRIRVTAQKVLSDETDDDALMATIGAKTSVECVREGILGYMSAAEGSIVIEYEQSEIKDVNVLQILPREGTNSSTAPISLHLNSDTFKKYFKSIAKTVGMNLVVTEKTTKQVVEMFTNHPYEEGDYLDAGQNLFVDYDMIVFGFGDEYLRDDIVGTDSNDLRGVWALNNIYDFIDYGKAVLFAHDTMFYSSYSDVNNVNQPYTNAKGGTKEIVTYAYNITSKFRNVIGMDRYGVAKDGGNASLDAKKALYQGFSDTLIMRRTTATGITSEYIPMQSLAAQSLVTTNKVKQLNTGAVTEYPYKIAETLPVCVTHAQWFQLDLESQHETDKTIATSDDVIVWYTLDYGSGSTTYKDIKGNSKTDKTANPEYFTFSGQDAVNNYYIYSKDNVTYSGAGHRPMTVETELKLFVNTIVKAILAGNRLPKVKVDNTVTVTNNVLEMPIRDIKNIDDQDVVITVSDYDYGISTNVEFKQCLIYWDVNNDGKYSSSEDVLLEDHNTSDPSSHPLKNRVPYTLDLSTYKTFKDKNNNKLEDVFNNNELVLGIMVSDARAGVSEYKVNLLNREYFELK